MVRAAGYAPRGKVDGWGPFLMPGSEVRCNSLLPRHGSPIFLFGDVRNWLHFQKLVFKTDILVWGGERSEMCLPRPRVFVVHRFSFSCYSFLSVLSCSYLFSSHSHFVVLLHSALSLPVSCSDVLQVSLRRLFLALVCVSFLPLWARGFPKGSVWSSWFPHRIPHTQHHTSFCLGRAGSSWTR